MGCTSNFNSNDLFCNQLTNDVANYMVRDVSDQEIRDAMFAMGDNKAPGPNGYTTAFFKEAWDIIATDVNKAIKEFFTNGVLLKELNHTILALIPKVTTPMTINDFHLISCCNVLYKCISKIISNQMKESLMDLRDTSRCAFKVDIQKAYDTVDWKFLHDILIGFGFHPHMIGWIMECVTSTSFSLIINGSLYGYFKGQRGLRQGDPISLYLFTLVMEVLTLMLNRRARDSGSFTYHRVIIDTLEEFKGASGLTPSLPKSTAYFCNVLNHIKLDVLNILPFEEDKLHVKYLGVPLVPFRLLYQDCKELMEKVKRRINDWKNKSLSLDGRAQLIRSVLASMHIYWASVFILLSSLMLELEQLMRGFLWFQGEMTKGRAKVAWEVVCLPKREGGLGIRHLEIFNKALITSHIWSLLSNKESLWVKWIHTYKLNGRSFWEILLRGKISWGWRKILQCNVSPFSDVISNRDIYGAGFLLSAKVKDIIVNASFNWPDAWFSKYNQLSTIGVPHLSNTSDRFSEVNWYHVVWFSHEIPRHAFHLWLVIKHKLKTQDTLRQWDVWDHLKRLTSLSNIPSNLDAIVDCLAPLAKMRSVRSVITKLVFAASCYFIWQECNNRLFNKKKRSQDQVTWGLSQVISMVVQAFVLKINVAVLGNSRGDVDLNAKIDNLRVRMQQSSLPDVNKYVGTQHTRPISGLQNPNSGLDRYRIVMDALHTDGDQIWVSTMGGRTSKDARDTTTITPRVLGIPDLDGPGHTKETIRRCSRNAAKVYLVDGKLIKSILKKSKVSRMADMNTEESPSRKVSMSPVVSVREFVIDTADIHDIGVEEAAPVGNTNEFTTKNYPHGVESCTVDQQNGTTSAYVIRSPHTDTNMPVEDGNGSKTECRSSPQMKLGSFASVVTANDVQVTSTNNEGYNGGNSCNTHSKPVEQVTTNNNFRSFVNEEQLENYDTVLPKAAMENVKHKYANTPHYVYPSTSNSFDALNTMDIGDDSGASSSRGDKFGDTFDIRLKGNKLPKGVLVSKGFQVGKEFAFKPKASNVGSNGDNGTRVETNTRVGPSNNINEGVLLNTMGTNTRQQYT
ncbi:hypothetical protein Tco_0765290, partial [Tanacetum coccineum]